MSGFLFFFSFSLFRPTQRHWSLCQGKKSRKGCKRRHCCDLPLASPNAQWASGTKKKKVVDGDASGGQCLAHNRKTDYRDGKGANDIGFDPNWIKSPLIACCNHTAKTPQSMVRIEQVKKKKGKRRPKHPCRLRHDCQRGQTESKEKRKHRR